MTPPVAPAHATESSATNNPQPPPNGLGKAFGLLGDEWTLTLIRFALTGVKRYSDFRAQLPISHAVLSSRLERLVEAEFFRKVIYQERPKRFEYRLTRKGKSVWPLLVAIWNWERTWTDTGSHTTPPLKHISCGYEMSPVYCCLHCSRRISADSVQLRWGPAGGWERMVSDATTRRRAAQSGSGRHSFYPDSMAVLGNRWSTMILAAAFRGITRFRDFETALGIPPLILAERLASLCEHQIFEQVQLNSNSNWSEYRLTPRGVETYPALGIIVDWAERWCPDPEGAVLLRTHRECGEAFRGVFVCNHCEQVLLGSTIDLSAAV